MSTAGRWYPIGSRFNGAPYTRHRTLAGMGVYRSVVVGTQNPAPSPINQ